MYYQPDRNLIIQKSKIFSEIIDEQHIIFKFLCIYYYDTYSEHYNELIQVKLNRIIRGSLKSRSSLIIGEVLDELNYFDQNSPSSVVLNNVGIKKVIKNVEDELDKKIQSKMALYSKEDLLLILTLLASVLSKITILLKQNSNSIEEKDVIDQLINEFNSIEDYSIFDPRVFLGELKSTLEHVLNRLLLTSEKQKIAPTSEVELDYIGLCDIFELFFAKLLLDSYIDFLPFINKLERDEISFSKEKGIILPNRILESFTTYIVDTRDEEVIIGDKKIELIMKYLQQVKKISPTILDNYISQPNELRGLKFNSYLSILEKNFLITDIQYNQSLGLEQCELILENLTLNNKAFYKNAPTNSLIGEPNMRLFRAPILGFSDFDLLPTFSFIESAVYFPYRILKSDILNKKNGKKWTELIKNNFDERLLPELKDIAKKYDKDCKINYFLNQSKVSGIKEIIEKNKLSGELDLVFIYQGTLYIYDLKNYGLARNVKQCKTVINTRIYNEFSKLNKLKSIIIENKKLFLAEFGRFKSIEVGVVTVNTTPYKYFKTGRVYSIPELRNNPELLVNLSYVNRIFFKILNIIKKYLGNIF